MNITFTKPVPDELWVDSFTANNTMELTYSGPETVQVLVEKDIGTFILCDDETRYNPDLQFKMTIDATAMPDIAYFVTNRELPRDEYEYETEDLPGGLTYERITNPSLFDYYSLFYDDANDEWDWVLITRDPKSVINYTADRYKQYVQDNADKFTTTSLKNKATAYLAELDTLVTTGKGSIPVWKLIEFSAADVPIPPGELISAAGVLP